MGRNAGSNATATLTVSNRIETNGIVYGTDVHEQKGQMHAHKFNLDQQNRRGTHVCVCECICRCAVHQSERTIVCSVCFSFSFIRFVKRMHSSRSFFKTLTCFESFWHVWKSNRKIRKGARHSQQILLFTRWKTNCKITANLSFCCSEFEFDENNFVEIYGLFLLKLITMGLTFEWTSKPKA